MESIYDEYKSGKITIEDVYHKCKTCLGLNKEHSLISTCLTLINTHPSPYMLRTYESVLDLFNNELEFVFNLLYIESPCLAHEFVKRYGPQTLMHPVEFHWRYMSDIY